LIEKWFGNALEANTIGRAHSVALEGKEKQMLDMARELEYKEEQKKKNQ